MKTNYILIASAASALFAVNVASADTVVQKGAQVTQYNNVSSVNNQSNAGASSVTGDPAAAQQALQSFHSTWRPAPGGSTPSAAPTSAIARTGAPSTTGTAPSTTHVINQHSINPSAGGASSGSADNNSGAPVNGGGLASSIQSQVGRMLPTNPAYRQAIGYPMSPAANRNAANSGSPQSGTVMQQPATVNSSNVSTSVSCSPSCTTTTTSSPNGTSTMVVNSSSSNNGNASAPSAAAIQAQINAAAAQAFQSLGGLGH